MSNVRKKRKGKPLRVPKKMEENKKWLDPDDKVFHKVVFTCWWVLSILTILWHRQREAWHATVMGSQRVGQDWVQLTELNWEIYMQVKKQQLELDVEPQTGSKSGKEYIKAVYCHSAYLTYMQSTSWEMLDCMKHKLESRLLGEISITLDTPHLGRKQRRTKEPLDESGRGEWKSWLKAQHSKN